jgi:hypothetical protein
MATYVVRVELLGIDGIDPYPTLQSELESRGFTTTVEQEVSDTRVNLYRLPPADFRLIQGHTDAAAVGVAAREGAEAIWKNGVRVVVTRQSSRESASWFHNLESEPTPNTRR